MRLMFMFVSAILWTWDEGFAEAAGKSPLPAIGEK